MTNKEHKENKGKPNYGHYRCSSDVCKDAKEAGKPALLVMTAS